MKKLVKALIPVALVASAGVALVGCEDKPATPAKKPADSKPADTKPADTKPADTKPADTKPAEHK